jgi:hypothetical protein
MSKANKGFKRERDSALSELEAQLRINARLRGEISVLKAPISQKQNNALSPPRANLSRSAANGPRS